MSHNRDRDCGHRIETAAAATVTMAVLSLSLSRGTEALPKPTKGERKRMSVAEFVEARFADFDRAYGLTAIDPTTARNEKISKGVIDAKNKTANNNNNNNNNGNNSSSSDNNNNNTNKPSSLTKKKTGSQKTRNEESESDEDDDACVTLTYFALLTSLYLPLLLFLWIRRSVFGAGSLIRSLFLGHILRLILAFLLLPPSTTKSLVPTWAWNLGVSTATRVETLWNDKRVQGMIPGWLHLCLAIVLGTDDVANHVSSAGSNTYDFPPALTALAIFTISVFVVHPDGLTWIMLGRLREGIRSTLHKTIHVIIMVKDGSITLTPSEISGTIAGCFIVYTIIRSIVSPKKRKQDSTPTPQKEKTTRNKHKKGRKGRGRNHHGNSGGGRGRIRGGHYRSAKDLIESSERTTSRSPSHSPCNRQRCDSDMEATTVSAISEVNVTSFDGCKKDFHQKSKPETTGSSLLLESRVEDENSCASSLATHHSNSASTQEGSKQSPRKGRGKKGRKNASNNASFLHQTECKDKQIVGFDEGADQMLTNNTNELFVPEEVSGDILQTHQNSQPDSRSKKKSCSQRPKNKISNKLPKSDAEFQEHSSTSFFSSPISPGLTFHQLSDNMEGQRMDLLKGNQHILPEGVSQRNVAVSSQRQSVQWQGTDSTPLFELPCSDKGQLPVNRYDATISQYEATSNQYAATSNQYEATSNQYAATSNQYEATSNQYEATSNQYEATNHKYEETSHQYQATSHSYEAIHNQYETANNQYEATYHPYTLPNNQQEAISNQYEATYHPYILPNNQQEPISNGHKTTHLQYEARPTRYKATSNQYETTLNTQTNPLPNYNVPNYEHAHSYFNAQNQLGVRKQELAAFFVEVQLNGTACKVLLENVEDIDALEKLTDNEFYAYGVELTKRVEIKALLEVRRRRQMFGNISREQNQITWSTGISPPPGLVPNLDSAVTASEALSNRILWKEGDQQQSTRSSYSPVPSSPCSGRVLSSSRILNLPQCNVDNRVAKTTTTPYVAPHEYSRMPVTPSISDSAAMFSRDHGQNLFGSTLNNDAKIEADLQELGGQMAGSILDF